MKKKYLKPTMNVYELQSRTEILVGSNYPPNWDGPIGYAPGAGEDKHLA